MRLELKIGLIALLFALISCTNNKVKEPEQIGHQVFEMLKSINTVYKEEYYKSFFSVEEARELGKNEDFLTDENLRNEMTSLKKEDWISRMDTDYNRIKEKAAKSGINWSEIKYLDFVYEIENERGMKGCQGELYFGFNKESYKVETTSLWNGMEYRLIRVTDFRSSR